MEPVAATVNVAEPPEATVCDCGCVAMTGDTATASAAGGDVTLPP